MKKATIILILASIIISFSLFTLLPHSAHAAGVVPCGRTEDDITTTVDETVPCTLCHLIVGIQGIISYGFKILVFVALVAIVGSGIYYILSAGNEQWMERAKNIVKYSLYGFGFVLLAWIFIDYSMFLLSTKTDLGIGAIGWDKFTCDTTSSAMTGGTPPPNQTAGVCGPSEGMTFSSMPTTGLCSAGSPTSPTPNGTAWNWGCVGTNGSSVPCKAIRTIPAVPDNQAPTTPSNLVATVISSTQIDLTWNASTDNAGGSGLDGYEINYGSVYKYTTATKISITGLTPATTYHFTVKAYDKAGNKSTGSSVDGVTNSPTAGALTINPSNWNAGSYPANTGSAVSPTFFFKNTGAANLTINNISSLSSPWSFDNTNNANPCSSGKVLTPNQQCELYVKFAPTNSGNFNKSFTVYSSDGSQATVSMTGVGTGGTPLQPGGDVDLEAVSFYGNGMSRGGHGMECDGGVYPQGYCMKNLCKSTNECADSQKNNYFGVCMTNCYLYNGAQCCYSVAGGSVSFQVKNNGSEPSGNFKMKLSFSQTNGGSLCSNTITMPLNSLNAGESKTYNNVFFENPNCGSHLNLYYYIKLDPNNEIKEDNENNNEKTAGPYFCA